MYQIALHRSVAEICVPVINGSNDLTMNIVRQGDSSVSAFMDQFVVKDGKARFRTNNDVHTLPYGLYKGIVMDGYCVCAEYPILISKCAATNPDVIESKNDCGDSELPPRDCALESCEDEPCPEDICDEGCGNKVGELAQRFPNISVTDIANNE